MLQIYTNSSHAFILFEDLSIYVSEHGCNGKMSTLIDEFNEHTELLQKYLNNCKDYNFKLIGDQNLYLVAQMKDKENLLIKKLKIVITSLQNEKDKNYFYDIDFK
ncbi:hypothetical protein ABK040_004953 [Willaertia magna]